MMLEMQGSAAAAAIGRDVIGRDVIGREMIVRDIVAMGRDAALADSAAQWADVRKTLHAAMDDKNFRSWVAPLAVREYAGGVLTLCAPTRFVRDWVRTHYADSIRKTWQQRYGAPVRVDIVIGGGAGAVQDEAAQDAAQDNVVQVFPAARGVEDDGVFPALALDARFTFESYIVGESNRLAVMAARQLATDGAVSFNPLYVYGGVGLGKTHLLQATAALLRQMRPAARVVYMSAEHFMFRFVQALRAKDTMAFKHFFRNVDVLLIDDVQFIGGKETTQEELFHVVNALMEAGKQVVVSADRAPAALDGIGARLLSRLGGGLVAEISAPDAAMRKEILVKKCAMAGRDVPEDVLDFLVVRAGKSTRALEGALNRLIAHSAMMDVPVTLESARVLLRDILGAAPVVATIDDIQEAVAGYYRISLADLLSARRLRPLARPRQVAMYLAKVLTVHSLPDIGRAFAGRDHTTILHGIRKVEALMAQDARVLADVEALKARLLAA